VVDQPTLELTEPPDGGATPAAPDPGTAEALGAAVAAARLVEVAVDAVGGGGARTWTYAVPAALEPIEDGEAVLVPYGRRQALGVVLGTGSAAADITPRPLAGRVRADGPLLPPLALQLARWISDHYLAPPAIVLRAMLPPEMLERLELVAERRPDTGDGATPDLAPQDADLLEQLDAGPRPVRRLAGPEGRAGLVRRLRALEAQGLVALDWTLDAASAGPRYECWVELTPDGRDAALALENCDRPPGRPLGPRQVDALRELADGDASRPAAPIAARHSSATIAGLVRRGLAETSIRERLRRPLAARPVGRRGTRPEGAPLTPPQREAVDAIRRALAARDSRPLLLDGVTGGGKSAIYAEAIGASLDAGRPALVLVPEISLALPLVDRLRAELDARVAMVHSGLNPGERADEWRRIRAGEVDIVAGTRLAALSPLHDVGVVIVDEEHDAAYKSDRTPRIQARDVAIELGRLAGAALVLGSATPAVDSVGRVRDGTWGRVRLPARPTGTEPGVEVIDLRAELQAGNRGLLSGTLVEALGALAADYGEQAILVINRRGTASVVMCRDCGTVQTCPECTRPLVFHQAGMTLRCHHCGRATPLATRCPECRSPRIRYLGGGTERVEREVRERLPDLQVARLDRDVVERRDAATRLIDAFADGRVDVLVGTGLVTKGLDIPGVTLVGIVSADVALNLPDERAAERTYQLLAQAIGRAGRGDRPGRAIVQTYQPEHPAIRAVLDGDPDRFYDAELDLRRRFGSPPFGRLVKLTVALADRDAAESAAREMAGRLRTASEARGAGVTVIGPAPAYIARRADRWRWNVVLRGPDPAGLLDGGLEPPWSVDVDPETLL
jgi:primosomal protein N' (replication factor Y) (superfamily II helicase)